MGSSAGVPVATGVLDYFPDALREVAKVSFTATAQHHPGTPMRWDRAKSPDEANCLMSHFLQRGKIDSDGQRHSAKVAWRALALLQKELETVNASRPAKAKSRVKGRAV
ncbi:MAG: dATP/dGTP diphosphohydrolase domain-containing protein [Acetobacteraceae bacterium]